MDEDLEQPEETPELDQEPEETPEQLDQEPEAPKKSGRPKLSDEEKKERRRQANQSYYHKTRALVKASKEPTPEPAPPQAPAPATPPPPRPKAKAKQRAPKPQPLKRQAVEEPISPRETLRDLWRQVRIGELERKQARYRSWFD